ncbi:hypothetical protein HanPI659440_Chr09g0344911 [Helianthus annuus]|nr:hypothetical protein HanPI659440_Chr09g0344911 [Helianthus annuus]
MFNRLSPTSLLPLYPFAAILSFLFFLLIIFTDILGGLISTGICGIKDGFEVVIKMMMMMTFF